MFVQNEKRGEYKMKKSVVVSLFAIISMLGISASASAQWFVDFEDGLAISGYNDVQIPRDTGTRFSLTDDLTTKTRYFFRIRLGYRWKSGHNLSVFAAPLTLKASGQVGKEIFFFEEFFPANTPLNAKYTFNSYRMTYRYDFVRKPKWEVGIGFTGKIRDAVVKVEGGGKSSAKTNVGFVPLINFRVLWKLKKAWGLLLEGDAAAAAQGRAIDVLLALQYSLNEKVHFRVGYRILEGGADVEEVYNFSLLHFLSAGVRLRF
jgi:hypothetical protein